MKKLIEKEDIFKVPAFFKVNNFQSNETWLIRESIHENYRSL
jgi:hypothetical protein